MTMFARFLARGGLGLALALVAEQASAQHRIVFGGSLSFVQTHDDNLFSTPWRGEPDDISRLSSRLVIDRRSRRFTLGARLGLDAETFGRHPELNTATAHQEVGVELDWAPSKNLEAAASAAYVEVQDPRELNTLTGLEVGRVRARRLSTTESLSRRLGALTKVTLEHSFTHEEVAGSLDNGSLPASAGLVQSTGRLDIDTQAGRLTLERRLGPGDRGRVSYRAQRFDFGGATTTSHVVTLGWSHKLTPLAVFELEAGPRLTSHTVGAEVNAGFRHGFQRGEAGVAYLYTQTTVVGRPGPVTTQGLTATFSRQLGRSFRVKGGPAVFRLQGQGLDAMVHRLSLEVDWRVTHRLSLSASHHLSLQYGELSRGAASVEVRHNTFLLQAVAASARN